MDIFRKEALDAAGRSQARPFGLIDYAPGRIVLLFVGLASAAAAFAATATYSRRETAVGMLVASNGAPVVVSPGAGVVNAISVRNGTEVKAGQVLMVVRREQKDESGANATAAIAGLQTDKSDADRRDLSASLAQSGIDRAGAEKRREGIARRIAQERQVLDLERRKAGIAKASYERVQPLLADRLISEVDVRKYETSWIEAEEAALASQQRIDSMEGDLSDAQAAVAKLSEQEKAYRARLDAQGAEAGIEKLSQEAETSFSVVAPVGGTVTGITARTGDAVAAQMPLAVIVPDGALLAELFVPSSAIGFVKPGGKVKLMVDAFPYQKFGFRNGAIATVSLAPVPQQARAQEQAEPMFVVQVRLDRQDMPAYGRSWALLPGMKVTADIVLEDRSFLEWLFDPVRATMMRL